jgi:hypothetical protein
VQLLLVQPTVAAHVCGQAVSRFFGVGIKRVRRIIVQHGIVAFNVLAAIATALTATACRHAFIVAFNPGALDVSRKYTYAAHEHSGQRKKWQQHDLHYNELNSIYITWI